MDNAIDNYVVIICVSGVLNVLLALYALFVKTSFSGIRTFMWMSVFCAVYAFGNAFELSSGSLEEIKMWTVVEYMGMPFIAPCCLLLVFHYAGMKRMLKRPIQLSLFVIPVISLLMVATNDYHHLFYRSVYLRTDTTAMLADVEIGEWYLVHGSFTFACLLVGGIILIGRWRRTEKAYRKQIATMIASLYIPMIGAFLYLMGLTPYGTDPVPVLMSVTSGLYIWALLSMRMLTVVPIARETIFESMRDGVLVLDPEERIVDYNRAAARMLPSLGAASIGRPVRELVLPGAGRQAFLDSLADEGGADERELAWSDGTDTFYYQIRSSPVIGRDGKPAGRTIMLIDATERALLALKMRQLATTDGLTGIYNRTRFMELAGAALAAARAAGTPLSFILLDIDHFKRINDRHGHDAGDRAIRQAVAACKPLLQDDDPFGRYGGEEFVICLPGRSLEQAAQLAERLREAIASGAAGPPARTSESDAAVAPAGTNGINAVVAPTMALRPDATAATAAARTPVDGARKPMKTDGSYSAFAPATTMAMPAVALLPEAAAAREAPADRPALIAITASFGVAQAGAGDEPLESVLKRADQALYAAKRDGRNAVRLAPELATQP